MIGVMEEGQPSEKEVVPGLDNTEEILPRKTVEQIVHICLHADVPGDLSDINVDEQEVTQPNEPGEKKMAPQQLRQSEIIQNSNTEYVNAVIVEDEVEEPKMYAEASHNTILQQAMEEEFIALEQNQTWELVSRLGNVKSTFCKWIYKRKCTLDGSIERYKAHSPKNLSTIWTRI